jgi:hypothetical protein
MNIDLIERGAPQTPFLRIFGREEVDISLLRDAVSRLHKQIVREVSIHELPGFQSRGGIAIRAFVGDADHGVSRWQLSREFRWILTTDTWGIVEGLVEGLLPVNAENTHQWLAGGEARYGLESSSVGMLLSVSDEGSW